MAPTRTERLTRLIVCHAVQEEDFNSVSTDVDFYFRLETDASNGTSLSSSSSSSHDVISEVASAVTVAAMSTIQAAICVTNTTTTTNGGGGGNKLRRLGLQLGHCMASISSQLDESRIVLCRPESPKSTSCSWFRSSLRLLHTDACTAGAVTSAVLSALGSISTSDILSSINNLTDHWVNATDVQFSEVPGSTTDRDTVTEMSADGSNNNQLTLAGFIFVLATALTLAALVLLIFVIRRRAAESSDAARQCVEETKKSTDTDCTLKLGDDGSYIGPEWGNLGGSHSSVDSHRCNSSLCKVCGFKMDEVKMLVVDDAVQGEHLEGLRSFSNDDCDENKIDENCPVVDKEKPAKDKHTGLRIHGLAVRGHDDEDNEKEDAVEDNDGFDFHEDYEVSYEAKAANSNVDTKEKVRFVRLFGWNRPSSADDDNKSMIL